VYIIDRTISSYRGDNVPPPEYAELELTALCTFLNVSCRQVRNLFKFLAAPERRFISRRPEHPWMYRPHPENFEKAPVIEPVKRPRKPRVVSLQAPVTTAALRREMHFPVGESTKNEGDTDCDLLPAGEVHFNAAETPQSEMQFTGDVDFRRLTVKAISEPVQSVSEARKCGAPAAEKEFRDPELRCPLGWDCPFTINGLEDDKPLSLLTINSKPASQELPAAENEGWQAEAESEINLMLTESEVSWLFPNQIPGPRLLPDTRLNLRGAPVELLKRRIWQRHKQGYRFESMGVVKALAEEVSDRGNSIRQPHASTKKKSEFDTSRW
jgi:hypothetical protein